MPKARAFTANLLNGTILLNCDGPWLGGRASCVIGVGIIFSPWALALAMAWPLQILRIRLRGESWERAVFLTLAKFPEALGALNYYKGRLIKQRVSLVEYK